MDEPDMGPALAVLVGGIGAILAADVWLMNRGHAPVTYGLRTPGGKIFLILLGAHVADILGPADPFRVVGFAARLLSGLVDRTDS